MSVSVLRFKSTLRGTSAVMVVALLAPALAGCTGVAETLQPRQTYVNGYVADQQTLDQVPVGSSREQVLLALGTPSTTNTIDGEESFYYISQTRTRAVAFMKPSIVSQKVLAVYFGTDGRVTRLADYGLQDGKVIDFISRTTPTGGSDSTFIIGVLKGFSGKGTNSSAASSARSILGGGKI